MPRSLHTTQSRMAIRQCVACGTSVLDHEIYESCTECGCAFDIRPPRSYEEMEGLVTGKDLHELQPCSNYEAWREQRLVERWLWFLFGAGVLLSIMLMVAAH